MKTVGFSRGIVNLFVLFAGVGLWAYTGLDHSLHYTEAIAEVERVEEVCIPAGRPVTAATSCIETRAVAASKRVRRHRAVYVRYNAPADGREFHGVIIPTGGQRAAEATELRPGNRWKILVHDDTPEDIKAE